MITYSLFKTLNELNDWYSEKEYVKIISIETINVHVNDYYKVWYEER